MQTEAIRPTSLGFTPSPIQKAEGSQSTQSKAYSNAASAFQDFSTAKINCNKPLTCRNFSNQDTQTSTLPADSPQQILWSMYNPLVPAPVPAHVNSIVNRTMQVADAVLDRCPLLVQQKVWDLLSWYYGTTHPRPKKSLLMGDFQELSQLGMFRYLLDLAANKGSTALNCLEFRIGPVPMLVPLKNDFAFALLRSNKMIRGFAYDLLVHFFGKGIFTSRDLESWSHQRAIALKLFHRRALTDMAIPMYQGLMREAQQACEKANYGPIDLSLLLSQMGLFVFCGFLHVDVHDIADRLAPAVNSVLAYINGALDPFPIPFGEAHAEFIKNRNIVHDWMREVILRIRNNAEEGNITDNPLIHEVLKATDPREEKELIELMISMVLGGHETTARLMLGAIYGLLRNPHYIEQIRKEAEAFIAEKEMEGIDWRTCFADRKSLPIIHAVIDEALRLFPPVWLYARSPTEDIQINGQLIHQGTQILFNTFVLNRDESVWGENAEVFYPERHAQDKKKEKDFFPFAAGKYRCPGDNFARMEAALAIIGLFLEFDIELKNPDQLPDPRSAGTFRLFDKLEVLFTPRF